MLRRGETATSREKKKSDEAEEIKRKRICLFIHCTLSLDSIFNFLPNEEKHQQLKPDSMCECIMLTAHQSKLTLKLHYCVLLVNITELACVLCLSFIFIFPL